MEIVDSKFGRDCLDKKSRKKRFGSLAKPMGDRISTLVAADNLEGVRNAPGRLNQMKGDRANQFEMRLSRNQRLIFEPAITEEEHKKYHRGSFDWSRITRIRLLEIYDPHGR